MTQPELIELQRIRLDRDLSYKALGEEVGLPEKTIHRILTTPRARIYDRTLHKIRRYLEAQRDSRKVATR